MYQLKIAKISLILAVVLVCTNCTTNHYQQKFRQQAFSAPSGIQEMLADGRHKSGGESDPSDWRTAPNFSGLLKVTPAYPNPVSYISKFHIQVFIKHPISINIIQVYAFRRPGGINLLNPLGTIRTLSIGSHTIKLSPQKFAPSNSTGNFGNVYRIILLTGDSKVITYGDIRVK